MATFSIEKFKIETVFLTIKNLKRSIDFYTQVLGLSLIEQTTKIAKLGTEDGVILVQLEENTNALQANERSAGLYHFAILVPERKDLAAFLKHILQKEYPLIGASDHDFSEAIYLQDPDDIGIEVYADRHKENWKYQTDGKIHAPTKSLDVQNLFRDYTATWAGFPNRTVIGHLHFHVSDIAKARAFYVDILGLNPTIAMGDQVLFVAGEGYHHHIGLNTWNGVGIPSQEKGTIGLKKASLKMNKTDYQRLVQQGLVSHANEMVDPFHIHYQIVIS
ncbi:VOC family protein [Paraliobacillus sp. X-1268]|uniref:VOC family protein n=1 Tax=Paraliobacillus sp. X-1268 TaxID=2213193 RepID=UPI000E3C947A|nr:VOC family protein [Paraliobacillus sp. X-1268]